MMEPLTMALDVHNLFWRTWYVNKNNPDEMRVLFAVSEFYAYLFRLNRDYAPARIIMAWDSPPYFRSEMYPPYKANREPQPGNWATQLHFIRKVADEAGITSVSKPGLEADDILATIAKRSGNCTIITSDKDLLALVSATTTVELLGQGEDGQRSKRLASRHDVKQFFGVFPEQVATFKALAGDSSDNIPGITGIGKKKAIWLLKNWLTFQGVYDHLRALTTATGKPLAIATALEREAEKAVLFKTICTPFVDEGMIIPEAKPLSIKAVSDALSRVPSERRDQDDRVP